MELRPAEVNCTWNAMAKEGGRETRRRIASEV